jgi:hypothetical protein
MPFLRAHSDTQRRAFPCSIIRCVGGVCRFPMCACHDRCGSGKRFRSVSCRNTTTNAALERQTCEALLGDAKPPSPVVLCSPRQCSALTWVAVDEWSPCPVICQDADTPPLLTAAAEPVMSSRPLPTCLRGTEVASVDAMECLEAGPPLPPTTRVCPVARCDIVCMSDNDCSLRVAVSRHSRCRTTDGSCV